MGVEHGGRRPLARRGCIFAIVALLAGTALGAALTLALLGLGWDVLAGRVLSPETAPVLAVGPTATPRTQAIQGSVAPGRRFTPRAPILLDTDTRTPDVLLASRNYDRSTSTLVYLSPDQAAVRWESPSLSAEGNEYAWSIAYGAETVVVAVESRLLGLSRATGELVWEAPLTDAISASICADCLRVFGDVVVALPQDGELQAFSLATGAPRWSTRLREATRQIVEAGGMIGVPDSRADDRSGSVLRRFAPADGAEQAPFSPECPDRDRSDSFSSPSYYDWVEREPRGRLLIWLVGSSPPCLLSLDSATGALGGRTYLNDFSDFDYDQDQTLWAGDTLYLSDGAQIVAVEPQGVRVVLASEDYTLRPLAAADGTLLLLAQRSRGSARYELWAIDSQSGARRWERVLEATDPLDSATDSGTFAAAIVGDAVALLEEHAEPEALVYELISLRDGTSRVRVALGVEQPSDDMHGIVWGREQLLLATDELYSVDLVTGSIVARWP